MRLQKKKTITGISKELENYEMLAGSFLMYKNKIIFTGKVKIEYIQFFGKDSGAFDKKK